MDYLYLLPYGLAITLVVVASIAESVKRRSRAFVRFCLSLPISKVTADAVSGRFGPSVRGIRCTGIMIGRCWYGG